MNSNTNININLNTTSNSYKIDIVLQPHELYNICLFIESKLSRMYPYDNIKIISYTPLNILPYSGDCIFTVYYERHKTSPTVGDVVSIDRIVLTTRDGWIIQSSNLKIYVKNNHHNNLKDLMSNQIRIISCTNNQCLGEIASPR